MLPPDVDGVDAQALVGAGDQQHDAIGGRIDDRDGAGQAEGHLDAGRLRPGLWTIAAAARGDRSGGEGGQQREGNELVVHGWRSNPPRASRA